MKTATVRQLDLAFPTIVRYVGLITTIILIGFSLAGFVAEAAPGFVAAAGMILYKTVHEASKDADNADDEKGSS